MKNYDHQAIEKKWQEVWEKEGIYSAESASDKPKQYILSMFPYPSGDGLHVGHVENYTATCIYARYFRMKGFNVLNPVGWDAFGLPSENYAIKTGVHPDISTHQNIKNFTAQMRSLGFSVDWTREIDTSSPEYYRWTQWFFLLLYKNGLAYKKKAKSNWCESCKTVLANEQAEGGVCERCKNEVIQKDLEQWFFKITDFAEELINDLDKVDWPSSSIATQRNWIGRSKGVEFVMKVNGSDEVIAVYTTRIDTVFGMTYVVLAPEHPLTTTFLSSVKNKSAVEEYIQATARKTDLERTELAKEKTGILLEGVEAINPFTQNPVPVYIGDYVLGTYGTGAVMAVPAHDERDFEFAKKYSLPIKEVIVPNSIDKENIDKGSEFGRAVMAYTKEGITIDSGEFSGMSSGEAREKIGSWVEKEGVGTRKINYRLRDWLVSRQRYWGAPIPIIYCGDCGEVPVPEHDLPVRLPTDVDFLPTGESPLARSKSFQAVACPTCGKDARREPDTMDTFVCSSWYYFRYADPRNEEEFVGKKHLREWLPVDMYMGGAEHVVMHLMYARFFTKVLKKLGYIDFDEPFLKLRHQGTILSEDGRKMSKSLGNVVNPNEISEKYGADTLRIHEMFLGPLEDMKSWNTASIAGPRRFLERVWRLRDKVVEAGDTHDVETILNKTIKKVGEDIESFSLNTAISALMVLLNEMENATLLLRADYEVFLVLLAPFAPHITEELWHDLGNTESIHRATWPLYDPLKIIDQEVIIAIQVNGKVRDTVTVAADLGDEEVKRIALERPLVAKWVGNQEIKKVFVVTGRLVNVVV